MEKQYKYSLQKGSVKFICPECEKKRFVRYINNETGEQLPERFGRCDREAECGYHLKPEREKMNFEFQRFTPKPKPNPVYIPFEVLEDTLSYYQQNVFVQNLLSRVSFPFDPCDVESVISHYYLGTVGGAVSFPFIDIQNNIRAIQVKRFDETNHTTKTTFLHSILEHQYQQRGEQLPEWLRAYQQNELKVSCLFGEHLLRKFPHNPVALVEAPKSAIYGTLYFGLPDSPSRFVWLAVYNLSSLNVEKCKALTGREVVLFPDLSKTGKAFELWSEKAKELNAKIKGARFTVSDLLECRANEAEREKGADIADFLILQDWRLFRESVKGAKSESETKHFFCQHQTIIEQSHSEKEEPPSRESANVCVSLPQQSKRGIYRPPAPTTWKNEIEELEAYFANIVLPPDPVKLNHASTIIDVRQFIESHLLAVKVNNGKITFLPHLERLRTLKQITEN